MRGIGKLALMGSVALLGATLTGWGVAQDAAQPARGAATSPDSAAPANAPPSEQGAASERLLVRESRYEIHAGDSFDVNFELSPEFNQTGVTVQPDGFITLRGVGDIQVDGQTVPQLTRTLQTAYSKTLHDPIISVVLKDFQKPYFIADGQVGKPGKYDLRGTVTLVQALAIAGGLSDSAKHSQVMLFRRVNDQWLEAKLFNVKKMEKSGKLFEDPFLHSGDMLFVPKNAFSKFSRFVPQASLGTMLQPY